MLYQLRTTFFLRKCCHMSPNPAQAIDQTRYFCSSVCLEFQSHAGLRVVGLECQSRAWDKRCCIAAFLLLAIRFSFPLLQLLLIFRRFEVRYVVFCRDPGLDRIRSVRMPISMWAHLRTVVGRAFSNSEVCCCHSSLELRRTIF